MLLFVIPPSIWHLGHALKDFGGGFLRRKMASTCFGMEKGQNSFKFIIGNALSDNLIRTIFEQVWFIPIESMYLTHESSAILGIP